MVSSVKGSKIWPFSHLHGQTTKHAGLFQRLLPLYLPRHCIGQTFTFSKDAYCLLRSHLPPAASARRQASLIESDNNFAWKRPLKVKDGWGESEVRCLQDVSVS